MQRALRTRRKKAPECQPRCAAVGTVETANRDLLLQISRCPLVEEQFRAPSLAQPCSALINAQRPLARGSHQVPEPWSGRLESAPILFFGSNPSINPVEIFPTELWPNDDIVDFFANRFGGGQKEWVRELRVLRHDGTHGPPSESVRFWAGCRSRATELLGRQAVEGVDFAISEVVHCKSQRERVDAKAATKLAARTCSDRYLRAVMGLSPARVIVSFGGIADSEIRRTFDLPAGRYAQSGDRHFIFLDHPAGRGALKKAGSVLTTEQRKAVRDALNQRPAS